jgi:hypothetical protein
VLERAPVARAAVVIEDEILIERREIGAAPVVKR